MDDQRYDVFICFRGDEPFGKSTIRRAIVKPLFDSLTKTGASVFMDDESIESGQPIPDTILQGILRTRGGGAALILVSPDFFSRVWPLIELACFDQAQHYPDQDQIHLFIVCLNVTPEYIKQAAFVKEKCPGVKEIKFVVAPTHIRCNESTQVVGWLSETVFTWIKSNYVALGRTRTESFNYFKTRLLHLPNQAEIGESLATYAKLNELLASNQPLKLSTVFAAAALANQLTEENTLTLSLVLSALKRDGKFLDTVDLATKCLNQYNKKWLNSETIDHIPPLQEKKSEIEEWFKSYSRLHLDTNSVVQAVSSQPGFNQTNSMASNSSTQTPSTFAVHNTQPVGRAGYFDLSRSYKTLTGHTDTVWSVAFSPDCKLLASASGDGVIRLWSVQNGKPYAELRGHESWVTSVAFSPNGQSIVTGSADCTVRTWSVATKKQVKTLNGYSKAVWSVAWSPNGNLIASGCQDKTIILWDSTSGLLEQTLIDHKSDVWNVSFSQKGDKLASAGRDNTAIIWNVNSGAVLVKLAHSAAVYCVRFSPDDQFVATGCADKMLHVFNVLTGQETKRFKGHTDSVCSIAFSFDGSMILSSCGPDSLSVSGILGNFSFGDTSVRLWDSTSTKQIQQFDGHTKHVWSVAFSRDGKYIASGSKDKTVRLWNASSSLQTPTSLLKSAFFAGDVQGALIFKANESTALETISRKRSKQLAEMLIEHGADINLRENSGSSALHAVGYQGHQEVVDDFSDCRLSINDEGNGVSSSDEQQSIKRQRYNESNCFARETVHHDYDAIHEDGHSWNQMMPNVDQVLQQSNDDSDSEDSSAAYSNSALFQENLVETRASEDDRSQNMEISTTSSSLSCDICDNVDITNSVNSKLGEEIADKMDELWRNNHETLDPLVLSDPEQIGEKGVLWYCHRDVKITRSAKNSKGRKLRFKVGNIEGKTEGQKNYTTQLAHDVDMSRLTSVRSAYNNLPFYDGCLFADSHRPCTMMPFATSVKLPPEIKKTIVDQIPSYSEKFLQVFSLPISEDVENPFTLEKCDFWIWYDPPKASKARQRASKVQHSTQFMNPAGADPFCGLETNHGFQCD